MKGKLLTKLKSISSITTTLKQSLVFQVNPPNQFKDEETDLGFYVSDTQTKFLAFSEPPIMGNSKAIEGKQHGTEEEEECTSFLDFVDKCPPGGEESAILYTTSLRGIRKTFEDCKTIKFLLESFKISYSERDVSMHMEFREELWKILGGRVVPPRLFIRGRDIGGADEVVRLHEQGKLRELLEGIPVIVSKSPCHGCAGVRFLLCLDCNGSRRKLTVDEQDFEMPRRCPRCNENGLIQCPICS